MISLRQPGSCTETVLRFAKGDAIYFQGDFAKHWFEVVRGIVRTCRLHADGHRQLCGFFYPGDVFGIDFRSYQASAEAVTDVVVRRRSSDSLSGDNHGPEEKEALQKALRSAHDCIFLLGHRTAAQRVAAFILSHVKRAGEPQQNLEIPMSRTDIADHLGLTMHTVSRVISDLSRRKIIALDGPQHLRLLDEGALWRLAGDEDEGNTDSSAYLIEYPASPAGSR